MTLRSFSHSLRAICTVLLDPRDPLLRSERTQGFTADPDYCVVGVSPRTPFQGGPTPDSVLVIGCSLPLIADLSEAIRGALGGSPNE